MNKTSISSAVLLAGVVAVAGVAQAETFDSPQQAGEASTMTHGAPNQLTTNSPYPDGTVVVNTTTMGAAPAMVVTSPTTVTTTTYPVPTYGTTTYYTYPSTHLLPSTRRDPRHAAAGTFDVPARAGEASTMTGGNPNASTDNDVPQVAGTVVVPVTSIPD